jgi:hypothetical protein
VSYEPCFDGRGQPYRSYSHLNMTVKTKRADGSTCDELFFAEVTCTIDEHEQYALTCFCTVEPDDNGILYLLYYLLWVLQFPFLKFVDALLLKVHAIFVEMKWSTPLRLFTSMVSPGHLLDAVLMVMQITYMIRCDKLTFLLCLIEYCEHCAIPLS